MQRKFLLVLEGSHALKGESLCETLKLPQAKKQGKSQNKLQAVLIIKMRREQVEQWGPVSTWTTRDTGSDPTSGASWAPSLFWEHCHGEKEREKKEEVILFPQPSHHHCRFQCELYEKQRGLGEAELVAKLGHCHHCHVQLEWRA